MVSCSGFGLPLHAQLLRLFVTTVVSLCEDVFAISQLLAHTRENDAMLALVDVFVSLTTQKVKKGQAPEDKSFPDLFVLQPKK